MGRKDSGNETVAITGLFFFSRDRKLLGSVGWTISPIVKKRQGQRRLDHPAVNWMRTSQSFLCFPIVLFMLSMLRRAYIWLLNELMSEREDVYLSVCVTLLWWYFQVGVAIPRLCCFISPWTMTVKNIVSLSVFHLNQPVWSLGEGQAPEELDKPIETPPLSILLIEKPQSATVSVGELTIKRIRSTNCCPWLQAANWSPHVTSDCFLKTKLSLLPPATKGKKLPSQFINI